MSTYSPSLRIELITTGDQAGTWGTTTNTNMGTLIESAIAGYTSVSITSANQALSALNGAADESRNMVLALTTTTTANFNVYAPPAEKTYVIYNASSYTATVYNSTVLGNTTAAGTGVAIPANKTMTIWSDGTNFRVQNDHLSSLTLGTDLAVADGGTGASTAADARTNLGLGTIATQNANAVNITGGSITGITDLAVADGGTGASSFTSGALLRGNGTSALSTASAADIVAAIGATAVQNATNATNATTATSPASGGSFITSSNIGSQSVNYAASAGTATNAFGIGQNWVDPGRSSGTWYQNTTGKPIMVFARWGTFFGDVNFYVNPSAPDYSGSINIPFGDGDSDAGSFGVIVVPPNQYYTCDNWGVARELRS